MNGSTSGRRPLIAAALAAALLAVAALAASCGGGGAGSAPDGGADAGAGSGAGSGDSGGGGGGSGGGGGGGQAPADPVASIDSPPAGTLFSAGETLTFAGSGSDAVDGTLGSNAFTWWLDLHHDTHTHPLRLPAGGAGGTVTIPTRGETSDNVFYRFHLRATNSAGRAVEVTRDVLPRKVQVTLATAPAGLRLALDGQPVLAPHTFTGVVGLERDIAAADHAAGGRRWRFDGWSHGGGGSQVIVTPAEATTYTANFTDTGAAPPMPPTVSLSAPGSATAGVPVTLTASATDSDGLVVRVEFLAGETLLGSATAAPFTFAWTPAVAAAGTTASLRARATDDSGLTADSAVVAVVVVAPTPGDAVPPTIALTAPAPLADGLAGMLTVSAEASDNVGVVAVEFQVDGAAAASEATSAPYTATIDTTQWPSGQHVVRVRARDAAGNRSPWASAMVRFAGNRPLPAGFTKDEAWVPGLSAATAFAQAGDGRFFVAEQGGTLRIVKGGVLLPVPFHTFDVDSNGERGLIGIALHPNFAANGYVYAYHTRFNGGPYNNRVTRLVAAGDVSTGVETLVIDLPNLSDATNHNGGAMKFGADGKLYVAVGDNVQPTRAPDVGDPFGKMLRLNDDGTFPIDNPFHATQPGWGRAVWASGLRNAFTFAVQPGTGRMHINDVGQATWEEINLGAAGANYGWPASEGPENVGPGETAPLFAYRHDETSPPGSGPGGFLTGRAIAGGTFYPATGAFPAALRGNYFFADYVDCFIGVLDLANGNAAYTFGRLTGMPVDMLAGSDGALYVLTREAIVRVAVSP